MCVFVVCFFPMFCFRVFCLFMLILVCKGWKSGVVCLTFLVEMFTFMICSSFSLAAVPATGHAAPVIAGELGLRLHIQDQG